MPITFNTTLTISELEHELERHEPEGDDHEPELSWSGPYPKKYLHGGFCEDDGGNPYRFETLEEAMTAANEIDDCQGITKYKINGFELRKVADIRDKYARKSNISWVKSQYIQ